ncbi:ABC transporter permease [soil metagenome]
MKVFTIAAVNLRRLARDRVNLFFLFVFPIVLILLLGVSFGGSFTPKLGLVVEDGRPLAEELAASLRDKSGIEVVGYGSRASLDDAVERGAVEAGVEVPAGYDKTLRSNATANVAFISRPGDLSSALRTAVDSAVTEQAARVRAARFAVEQGAGSFDAALRRAGELASALPGVSVASSVAGGGQVEAEGRFDQGASTQLLLFVFVNSLAASAALVQVRRLGLARRMLSTPTPVGAVLLGEGLGRFLIAAVQALFIVLAAWLLFGVDWGDPVAAGAVIAAFSLVATGAALFFGATLANEQQTGALLPLGLGLAALGGCMVPLEVFSPTMHTVALATPHAWANEAFNELLNHGGGIVDVLPQIGVLLGFAGVLLALATWRLRAVITA